MYGLPFILLAWVGMWLLRPLSTFLHELGHAFFAIWFTSGDVEVRVGKGRGKEFQLGDRLLVELSFGNGWQGYTRFSHDEITLLSRLLILLGGPIVTFMITSLTGFILFTQVLSVWLEVPLISWFCCNALAFFRAIIPMRLKPTDLFPEGPPSDGLQIVYLVLGKKWKE